MAAKSMVRGIVTSDKMDKSVVVAVERQVRHGLYGKSQRRTSTFLAHNEGNAAKVGDLVEIREGRPMSRRKRWVVTRVVRNAAGVQTATGAAGAAGGPTPTEG
ncbi:MAG: 30S ribosomal protein S17 [Acidobacteria bacterium]|nr:30S ribosomal protein S17 [Acidobacteriota bacterium]MBE3099473.1 30S ribosomal protein S17 [Planctomycetota bacterium]MBE3134260.1 30S ribosomal protein S17 [Acidobacteriota bacterium]